MTELDARQSADFTDAKQDISVSSTGKYVRRRHPLRDVLETALIAVLIIVLVRTVVQNILVDGGSMLQTLTNGERILVNRNAYQTIDVGDLVDWIPGVPEQHWFTITDWGERERGDVIVFMPPEPSVQSPFVKRVIGLPG